MKFDQLNLVKHVDKTFIYKVDDFKKTNSSIEIFNTLKICKHILLLGGKVPGKLKINTQELSITAGNIFLFSVYDSAKKNIHFVNADDTLLICIREIMHYPISQYEQYLSLFHSPKSIFMKLDIGSFEWKYINILSENIYRIQKSEHKNILCNKIIQSNIEAILYSIYTLNNTETKELKFSNYDIEQLDKKILEFIDLIYENLGINHTIDFYLKKMLISHSKLNSLCLKYTLETPHNLIRKIVLKKAKELLLYSNYSIKEIGYDLGFSVPTNFNKFFIQAEGLTPRKYRIQYIKN
jgi:AraC-like DNA-binding protein